MVEIRGSYFYDSYVSTKNLREEALWKKRNVINQKIEAHHVPVSRYHPRCFHQGICLGIDRHITVRRTHLFGQGIIRVMSIESSETNSLAYPRLLIDANQIKWCKIHILSLDFDWCLIEVTIKLRIICTSIGSLEWIALPPHSSLMKCKDSYLRRGELKETHFPRDRTRNRSFGPQSYTSSFTMGPWICSSCSIRRSSHSLHEHEVSSQRSCSFLISLSLLGILVSRINPQAHGYRCSFHLRVFQGLSNP